VLRPHRMAEERRERIRSSLVPCGRNCRAAPHSLAGR
jgi:hypothetical protein